MFQFQTMTEVFLPCSQSVIILLTLYYLEAFVYFNINVMGFLKNMLRNTVNHHLLVRL